VSFDIVVHISVVTTGAVTNTASVRGNDTDTNPASNTATATTVVSPQTTPGKVTGGGVIDVPGGKANFGFVAQLQAVLLGTSLLGRPQNINVVGRASSGSLNADGSAVFAGLCTVDMGDGTPPLIGLPFSVTATTESLRLILGTTPLPAATLTAGSITIQ